MKTQPYLRTNPTYKSFPLEHYWKPERRPHGRTHTFRKWERKPAYLLFDRAVKYVGTFETDWSVEDLYYNPHINSFITVNREVLRIHYEGMDIASVITAVIEEDDDFTYLELERMTQTWSHDRELAADHTWLQEQWDEWVANVSEA